MCSGYFNALAKQKKGRERWRMEDEQTERKGRTQKSKKKGKREIERERLYFSCNFRSYKNCIVARIA
jgi:hypothetical protein